MTTRLLEAAEKGNLREVKNALDQGVNVNDTDGWWVSLLKYYCDNNMHISDRGIYCPLNVVVDLVSTFVNYC